MSNDDEEITALDRIEREKLFIDRLPKSEFGIDFQTFVWLADRWAELGDRQRAAALAMARGSMDSATDLIGPPLYHTNPSADSVQENETWHEVNDLVFDIQWHCESDGQDDADKE